MRRIDADALKEEFKKRCHAAETVDELSNAVDDLEDLIDNAPTVESPKGRWIVKTFKMPVFSGEGDVLCLDIKMAYECSNCNTHWDYATYFCPFCGAEMEGE